MSKFQRTFDFNKIRSCGNNIWINDLLNAWAPPGIEASVESGKFLRISVRHNYLNFYYKGQSIAKVGSNRDSELYMETHIKYVDPLGKGLTQAYARLSGADNQFMYKKAVWGLSYNGVETIKSWTRHIDAMHKSDEKSFVDDLLSINENVIDLELAISSENKNAKKVAKRIDIAYLRATIEGVLPEVVFCEVKLSKDGRCRTKSGEPEVVKQTGAYQEYLSIPSNIISMEKAYKNTCVFYKNLGEYLDVDIPSLVLNAADEGVVIYKNAVLLVADESSKAKSVIAWAPHSEALKSIYGDDYLECKKDTPLSLK